MENKKQSRRRFGKKALCLSLTAALAVTAFAGMSSMVSASGESPDAESYGLAETIQEGTILHCFDWKYKDIEAELENIAKAGFTSVQTSPAQGGPKTGVWYWLYQPLGFSVKTSDLGTKEELQSLCEKAQEYGIKVVVDVVANHLAGNNRDQLDDPFADDAYWHNGNSSISYSDRHSITHDNLGKYGDINSENQTVIDAAAAYVDELASIGVSGIRWDAAKHIGLPSEDCAFWSAVTNNSLYHYGEILDAPVSGSSSTTLMQEYTQYMSVTDNRYGNGLMASFKGGVAPASDGNWIKSGISADKLVYWGESHDTYANKKDSESNGVDQNVIDRAYAVAAARKGSSALYLSRPYNSVPDQMMIGEKGSMQFTAPEIAAVNHFHNKAGNAADQYAVEDNVSMVYREGVGVVIVLGSGGDKQISVSNVNGNIPTGTIYDEVTGNRFEVTDETISGTVGSSGIAVIYDSDFSSRVEASVVTDTKFEDSLDVTLRAFNVTGAAYYLSYADVATQYFDGDVITIGEDVEPGSMVTLKLEGQKEDGTVVTAEYNYIKANKKDLPQLSKGGVIFDNDTKNWNKVFAYVYDERTTVGTVVQNADWPGIPMTADDNNLFSYEFPEDFLKCKNIMVIFNNGAGDQLPAQNGFLNDYYEVGYYDGGETLKVVQTFEKPSEPSDPLEPAREASRYSIVGTMTNWTGDIPMYDEGNGMFVGKFTVGPGTHQFKVRADGAWTSSWGPYDEDNDSTMNIPDKNCQIETTADKTTVSVTLDTSGDEDLWSVSYMYPSAGDDSDMSSMVFVNTGKPSKDPSEDPSEEPSKEDPSEKPSEEPSKTEPSKTEPSTSTPVESSTPASQVQPSTPGGAPVTGDSGAMAAVALLMTAAAIGAAAIVTKKSKSR